MVNGYARMGVVRDFATVKDACPASFRPEYAYPAAAIPMLFLLFCLREIKLVGTCVDVQTVHGARSSGLSRCPFSGPGKESAGMQPTLLVTTGRRHNVDGHPSKAGQILYRSKFNAPYLASIVHRLHLGSFAGGWRSLPLPSRGKVVQTLHTECLSLRRAS